MAQHHHHHHHHSGRSSRRSIAPFAWLLLVGVCVSVMLVQTTNDMPIVDPQGFDALNLFPLQINPHFTNALPEGHKGETREQRIRELLVVAPELTIIGLPEGNWITVSKGHATLGGPNTTYVFKAGEEAVPLEAGHRF